VFLSRQVRGREMKKEGANVCVGIYTYGKKEFNREEVGQKSGGE